MSKVSIVVPVYNVESYLPKCLDSLINQTEKDIEIILIDDGSTDSSGRICDKYAEIDSRICVVHKQNEGLSAARNDGIDASHSPYIMFVDSDDWVAPYFCMIPLMVAMANNADLVLFSFDKVDQNGKAIHTRIGMEGGLLSKEQALCFNSYFAPAIWLGLYKKKLFDKERFPNGKLHEDTGMSHCLKYAADSIWLIPVPLYFYRSGRPGSILSTPETRESPDYHEMLRKRVNDLCGWGYESIARQDAMYLLTRYGCKSEEQKYLVDIVKRIKGFPKEFNLKRKLLLASFKVSPSLFDFFCKMMGKHLSLDGHA